MKNPTMVKCPKCEHTFNYNEVPECSMGAVKCPECGSTITQENLVEDGEGNALNTTTSVGGVFAQKIGGSKTKVIKRFGRDERTWDKNPITPKIKKLMAYLNRKTGGMSGNPNPEGK